MLREFECVARYAILVHAFRDARGRAGFIDALPLTALIDALRANMLEGASIGVLGAALGTLTVWRVLGSALLLLRWR